MTTVERYASAPWAVERGGLLDELLDRPAWQSRAACRGMGTAVFFPERDGNADMTLDPAREVCARCPVRSDCLEYAVEAEEPRLLRFWGGTSERDRRALRREIA